MRRIVRYPAFALTAVLVALSGSAFAVDLSLVGTLVSQLGVTEKQASGGAGAILGYAKDGLSTEDYGKVTKALPEVEKLAGKKEPAAAPQGTTGGLSLESVVGAASGAATVYDSFKKQGLSMDMVGKFVPVILTYAKTKGGDSTSGILGKALNSLSAAGSTSTGKDPKPKSN